MSEIIIISVNAFVLVEIPCRIGNGALVFTTISPLKHQYVTNDWPVFIQNLADVLRSNILILPIFSSTYIYPHPPSGVSSSNFWKTCNLGNSNSLQLARLQHWISVLDNPFAELCLLLPRSITQNTYDAALPCWVIYYVIVISLNIVARAGDTDRSSLPWGLLPPIASFTFHQRHNFFTKIQRYQFRRFRVYTLHLI